MPDFTSSEMIRIAASAFLLAVIAAFGWHAGRLLAARYFGPIVTIHVHQSDRGQDHG